ERASLDLQPGHRDHHPDQSALRPRHPCAPLGSLRLSAGAVDNLWKPGSAEAAAQARLWITGSSPITSDAPETRGFLSASTSDTDVVSYSSLISTDLSTDSTAVNTVKRSLSEMGYPITRQVWRETGPRRDPGSGGFPRYD